MRKEEKAGLKKTTVVTCDDLSSMTNLARDTIRTYLQGYRFSKYETLVLKPIRRVGYRLTKEFIKDFASYLELKNQIKAMNVFERNVKEV